MGFTWTNRVPHHMTIVLPLNCLLFYFPSTHTVFHREIPVTTEGDATSTI